MDNINGGGEPQTQMGYESISGGETMICNEINAIQSKQQIARRKRRTRLDKQRQYQSFLNLIHSDNFPHVLPNANTEEESISPTIQHDLHTNILSILFPTSNYANTNITHTLLDSAAVDNIDDADKITPYLPFSKVVVFWKEVYTAQNIDGRIGYETTNQYIGRLIIETSNTLPRGIFDSNKNAQQRDLLEQILKRLRDDFVAMSKEEGSGVSFPFDGKFHDLPPLAQPGRGSGGGRIYCAVVERLLSSGGAVEELVEEVVEDSKIGSTWITNEKKKKFYDEKKDVVSTTLKNIYSIEQQGMESQRNSRDRFDATNKFIVGDTTISKDTTLGEALDMERESIPFLSLVLRQLCLDKHGSRVAGLVSKTFLKDMESGAQESQKRIPGRDESSVRNRWYNAKTSEKKAKSKAEQASIQKQNVDSSDINKVHRPQSVRRSNTPASEILPK